MRKFKFGFLLFLFVPMAFSGCNHDKFSLQKMSEQYSECIGSENYDIMLKLSSEFEGFLADNKFVTNGDILEGYKGYLQHLLDRKGLDTSWYFRLPELEVLMQEVEALHLAELIYEGKVSQCAIDLEYPQQYIMAGYREIMPQHSVSPEVFMRTFVQKVDQEQFKDPVLKSMI
ncbi:MAG: hypothetical protein R6V49_10605, partial [Bacteroidales bacterium]